MLKSTIVNNRKLDVYINKNQLLDDLIDYDGLLVAIGAEKLLSENLRLIEIINRSKTYCDGFGAVYALKRKGYNNIKIAGSILWLDIIKKFLDTKTFYFLGSDQRTLNKTINKLKLEYPKIKIAGKHNGFFKENKNIIIEIKKSNADIIFVAMGTPKQEFFMNECYKIHKGIYMGLGGSFDLYIGKSKKVPEWWIKYLKWEGLYRTLFDLGNIKRIKRQKIFFKYIFALISGRI